MGLFDRFKREKRSAGSGNYTAQMLVARNAVITGRQGVAELSATVQSCIGMWEAGLSQAAVQGAPELKPATLAIIGRQLATTGDAVFLITEDGLRPANGWDVKTKQGQPTAYRLELPDMGGSQSVPALAAEVFHVSIGSAASEPWHGSAPLHRASLTAELLQAIESTLRDVYTDAPIGSQVVPFPESQEETNNELAQSFRGQRGRVLLRESTAVTAAGGPTPQTDWRPSELTPNLGQSGLTEMLPEARDAILAAYGVLPTLLYKSAPGTSIYAAERHLAQWQLQPIAGLIAQEARAKLGDDVSVDTLQPLQGYDAGTRSRALAAVIRGLSEAKAAGLSDEQLTAALQFAGVPSAVD